MPKYKADIFPHGGGNSHVAYVESDDQWSAEALLKLQYPNCDVRWLQKVSVQAASPDVADTAEGSLSLPITLSECCYWRLGSPRTNGSMARSSTMHRPSQWRPMS